MTRFEIAIRYLLAALSGAAFLCLAGCSAARRDNAGHPTDDLPRVRVEGARVLEADPEHPVEQGPMPPAVDPNLVRKEFVQAEPKPAGPPDGLADGVTVELDLVDARAADALRGLAYQGDVDMIITEKIDRRVTVHLKDTPWIDAFEAVLDGAGLVAEWQGSRVRVLTADQLQSEQESADRLQALRPTTRVIGLQNLPPEETAQAVSTVLSAQGRIGFDLETNSLIVTDTKPRIRQIQATLQRLDRTPPQVMIEAVIVDLTLDDRLGYGVDWSASKTGDGLSLAQALTVGAGVNPVTSPGGNLIYNIIKGDWSIQMTLDAVESNDDARVLANPRILAINNRAAQLEIIEEIPFQELTQTSEGGQIGTTNFKEVGIKLAVVPRIAADGHVHLDVVAEQSTTTSAAINQIPVIQTRRSESVMTVANGQTIVLSGLRRRRTTNEVDKIPVLGDLPLIGGAFRRNQSRELESELIVFIRTWIVHPNQPLTDRQRILAGAINHADERSLLERSDPCRLNVDKEEERRRTVP